MNPGLAAQAANGFFKMQDLVLWRPGLLSVQPTTRTPPIMMRNIHTSEVRAKHTGARHVGDSSRHFVQTRVWLRSSAGAPVALAAGVFRSEWLQVCTASVFGMGGLVLVAR